MREEGRLMTCSQLVAQVQEWNVEFRLKEKYHTWRLKYSLPKVPASFYRLVEHSLISYVLGNFSWLLKANQQEKLEKLSNMKSAYAQMNLGSSISSQIFNFWMVLLVKLSAYFLSNHVAAVLVDITLQCDIYRHTMLHVLGIQIEKNTYRILLRMFTSRREASKERESLKLERDGEEQKENDSKIRTIQSIGRRNGKHQTTFFNNIASLNEERARLEEIKYLLKSNLYVKPVPRKIQPKYSISELKLQNRSQGASLDVKARATPTGKFTIQANQLSQAFSSNYVLRLNDIKNHSIHCSHTKNVARPEPVKTRKKLEIRREEEHRHQDRRGAKPAKNWLKLVTEMKEQLYQHKGARMSEEVGPESKHQERQYMFQEVAAEKTGKAEQQKQSWQPNEEVFRFRKLNLMNSPNIVVYDDCHVDLKEEQPSCPLKNSSIKMNRSRLERADRQRNTPQRKQGVA